MIFFSASFTTILYCISDLHFRDTKTQGVAGEESEEHILRKEGRKGGRRREGCMEEGEGGEERGA